MRAKVWLSLVAFGCGASGFSQMSAIHDALPLAKDAIFLLPADQASATHVEEFSWSSDGKYLLIRRRLEDLTTREWERVTGGLDPDPSPVHHQLAVYSALTGKTKVLVDVVEPTSINSVFWIPNTDSAIVESTIIDGTQAHTTLNLVSAVGGPTGSLGSEDNVHVRGLGSYPELPYVWFSDLSPEHPGMTEIHFIGEKGIMGKTVYVPAVGGITVYPRFGKLLYFVKFEHGKRVPGGWSIDPTTGDVERVETIPATKPPVVTPAELQLAVKGSPVENGDETESATVVSLSSPSAKKSIIVSTDGEQGELAPGSTAISYSSRGSLMVRRVVHVPLEYYKNQLRLALRAKALNTAKQLGLALIMCASDYDDKLPSNADGWKSKIDPYLKSPGLANAFNYTFAGGSMTAIESPATTILGYVSGPDGRAVVYADGHAKYISQ